MPSSTCAELFFFGRQGFVEYQHSIELSTANNTLKRFSVYLYVSANTISKSLWSSMSVRYSEKRSFF